MREIARILCPVDVSDVSQPAIDHTIQLARWYQASITALHVCQPISMSGADFVPVGGVSRAVLTLDEINEARERVLACFASAGGSGVDVVVEDGRPANQILELARSLPADLIVIGTHGAGGFQHLLLGSVTEKVLRQATCPVLTVPPRVRMTSSLPFKRLLCPIDFSDSSLAALEFAFSLAQESDADLQILHVCEWTTDDEPLTTRPIAVPEYRQLVERDIVERLAALVPESTRESCRPSTRVGHGKAYREILGVATEESADLIVMGVHGRNALDVMLFGSTTNQVVRRATCPVLTLRR